MNIAGYTASRLASLTENMAGTANDLTQTFAWNPGSQIVTKTSSNATYDWNPLAAFQDAYGAANGLNQYPAAGGAALVYDANGNLTGDGAKTYSYDASNRLKSAAPAGGGAAVALAWDPASRLYEVAGTATTKFLYDGADIIAEYSGAGILLRRYVHGPGIDEPLAQYDGAGTASRKYLHADARGSIIALSDASGAVVAKNTYDPYGAPQAGNSGLFQYTGQVWLAEAGLYHYKARAYHPGLGRFLQTDPIGYGDGMNMYAYAGNDPVNGRDPSGLQRKDEIVVTGHRNHGNWKGNGPLGASINFGSGGGSSFAGGSLPDEIVVVGHRRNPKIPPTKLVLQFDLTYVIHDPSGGSRDGSAERQACLSALENLRGDPSFGNENKVLGVSLFYDSNGVPRSGYSRTSGDILNFIIAAQTQPISLRSVTIRPDPEACEGRGLSPQAFRDCLREPASRWVTTPGKYFSSEGNSFDVTPPGGTPFALLISRPLSSDAASDWADALGIPKSRILVNSCEGL